MEIVTNFWGICLASSIFGLIAIISFTILRMGEFKKVRKIFWTLFLISLSILGFFWFSFFFPELFSVVKYSNQSDSAIIVYGWESLIAFFAFLFFILVWLENKYNRKLRFPFGKFSKNIGFLGTILTAVIILVLAVKILEARCADDFNRDNAILIEELSTS